MKVTLFFVFAGILFGSYEATKVSVVQYYSDSGLKNFVKFVKTFNFFFVV